MIHFRPLPKIHRTASERIAQRRRVDMAAELRAEITAGVADTDAPDEQQNKRMRSERFRQTGELMSI